MQRLLAKVQSEFKRQLYKLKDRTEFTETTEPEGGFCLRYTIMRRNFTAEEVRERQSMGYTVLLKQGTLIPMSDDLGEPVEDAFGRTRSFTGCWPSPASTTPWSPSGPIPKASRRFAG